MTSLSTENSTQARSPWLWVPSLYLAQGIPYVMVMTVSVIMYKKMNISNAHIALYTSWLYLPWVIKPLWSPFVDMFKTKRLWVVLMQFVISLTLIGIAWSIPGSHFLVLTMIVFSLMAFASATHDIAADGFYMLSLDQHQQAAFVGVRSTFYRIAMITSQGALVVLAGSLEPKIGIPHAWAITFGIVAGLFFLLFIYHRFILPRPDSDKATLQQGSRNILNEFLQTFVEFFKKKEILVILVFLFFYRFAEAQLVKLVSPFLLDPIEKGGLGLSTSQVGIVYGTVGIMALTAGGLLGGYVISRKGLRWWLWPMVIIMHTPDLMFVYLSQVQPTNFVIINIAVALEQFGYGFGFTAYMMYMIMISRGDHPTAHYAICTGIMAIGMMLPGMLSGKIQELVGYQHFFLWIIISTIPGFLVPALVKIDPEFGKKKVSGE
jgi:MFS transporter, PAT family, beta-lactamase induction signal transducer AmpG